MSRELDAKRLQKLVDALCTVQYGWSTEFERKLYKEASNIVNNHAKRLRVEAELRELETK